MDKIREVNRPIISGEGAVFCPPIQKITVMNSKLVVECTVPVNCLHVHLPWTEKVRLRVQYVLNQASLCPSLMTKRKSRTTASVGHVEAVFVIYNNVICNIQ